MNDLEKTSSTTNFETDVLVVGGGGAGLAAAITAAETGCRVVLLEKEARLGGSTAWSVGSISVNSAPHQARVGIADSAEAHDEDLAVMNGALGMPDNPELRRLLVDNITDTFGWLEAMGLVFVGPMPEPPHRVPRMHNVLPNSRAFPARLGRRARALGVDIRCGLAARDLLEEDGHIVGARAEDEAGGTLTIRARGGVVLAGGDYSANPGMLARLASDMAARLAPVNPAATGDGITLGEAAGGHVLNGPVVRGPVLRFVPPPPRLLDRLPAHPLVTRGMRWAFEALPAWLIRPFLMRFLTTALGLSPTLIKAGAILVDRDGRRVAEAANGGLAQAVADRPGGLAWVVFDAAIAARFEAWPNFVSTAPGVAYAYLRDYRRARPDIFFRAATPEALAAKAGLPAAALADTLAARIPAARIAAGAPPWVAPLHALGPVRAYVAFTDGGLSVDRSLRVLDSADAPIPGLYAAGSNGQGGALLEGHGHHLGWAFVSGRLAGREAARAARRNTGKR